METAFSVWGSDDESELDHGVGGFDPAHQDNRRLNGQANARERPALITIKIKMSQILATREDLAIENISNPRKFLVRRAAMRVDLAIQYIPYQSNGIAKYPMKWIRQGGKQSKATLPSYHLLCPQQTTY